MNMKKINYKMNIPEGVSKKFINEKQYWYEYDCRMYGKNLKCSICGNQTLLVERVYVYPNFKLHINDEEDYTKSVLYCEKCKDKVKRPHRPKKPKWLYVDYAHKKFKIKNDETFYDEFEKLKKDIDSRSCYDCVFHKYVGQNRWDMCSYYDNLMDFEFKYAWECDGFKETEGDK